MEAVFSNLDTYWLGFKGTLELLAVGGLELNRLPHRVYSCLNSCFRTSRARRNPD